MTAELKTLAIESLAGAIFGLEPGPELARLLADNAILAKAFVALPIKLPGTAYTRGLQARDRILALLEAIVRRHVDSPPARPDGLSRILAAAGLPPARRSTPGPQRARCITSCSPE